MEQFVAAIWQDVLGVEPVGINDDFTALGGGRPQMLEALAKIRAVKGVEMPIEQAEKASTVAALAEALERLTQR